MRYYQEDDEKRQIFSIFLEELELAIKELDKFLDIKWHQTAIDYIEIERSDFVDLKPTLGSRFATFRLKLERCHEDFAKQFKGTMNQIEDIFIES